MLTNSMISAVERPTALRARFGFTVIELALVLTISAVCMAMVAPKFQPAVDAAKLRSAKTELASYLTVARASAIRRNAQSQVLISGSSVTTTVSVNGTQTTFRRATDLSVSFGVTFSGSPPSSITFDPRGFLTGSATAKYVLVRGTLKDSVCVTSMGIVAVQASGCAL
jgi:prepilin-type N-terminal cleavage/methylation domain-containing protein